MRAAARTLTTHAHRAQKQIAKLPSLQRSVEVGRFTCGARARSVFSPRSPSSAAIFSVAIGHGASQAEATQCRRLSPLRSRPSLLLLAESWPTASGAPAAPAAPAAALPSSSAHEPGGRLTSSWSPKRRATMVPYRRRHARSRRGMTCCSSWSGRAGRGSYATQASNLTPADPRLAGLLLTHVCASPWTGGRAPALDHR